MADQAENAAQAAENATPKPKTMTKDEKATVDRRRRLRAIRRLSRNFPSTNAAERLEQIASIAQGGEIPDHARPNDGGRGLVERMEAGRASRARRTAEDKLTTAELEAKRKSEAAEAKRAEKAAKDREERGGRDRSA